MAGKQLGKLRQWAGEVISVRDKTIVSDEFKELEHDIELRRQGLWKLHAASDLFHHRLSSKKPCSAIEDGEKFLPIDALGIVMMQHGDEFGEDSAFGTSLVALGRAHCQVATLQEAFALNFEETYLASLQRAEDEIKEYQAQRKKLESRRLTYDAAIAKVERIRSSKKEKEKDRKEAEDEYEVAKSRYEEMNEDVRVRMFAIQENEIEQLRDLTNFLDDEIHFAEQYLDVLKEAKSQWIDEVTLMQMERTRKARPPPLAVTPGEVSRTGSMRSKRSVSKARSTVSDESEEDDSEADLPSTKARRGSLRKTEGSGSRPPSRPQSRTERKRADSTVSNATEKGEKKEKEKADKNAAAKRKSIGGWASSISKMTGRGKNKDRGKFDSLMGDRDELEDSEEESDSNERSSNPPPSVASKPKVSKGNTPNASPQIPARILKPQSQQDKKLAVALHDFAAASSDELSFKAGDQIVVLNEVIDGWWMGKHTSTGKTGLFPTTYTEVLNASTSSLGSKPVLPRRPSKHTLPPTTSTSSPPSPVKERSRPPSMKLTRADVEAVNAQHEHEADHPFGDNHVAASRSPLYGAFDSESIASDTGREDDDDEARLVPAHASDSDDAAHLYRAPPPPLRRLSTKKAAPPPPPPRRTNTAPGGGGTSSLAVPPRTMSRAGSSTSTRSNSTNNSFVSVADGGGMIGDRDRDAEYTLSPFDNPAEGGGGCGEFKQNPFKPRGFCSNCFRMHA